MLCSFTPLPAPRPITSSTLSNYSFFHFHCLSSLYLLISSTLFILRSFTPQSTPHHFSQAHLPLFIYFYPFSQQLIPPPFHFPLPSLLHYYLSIFSLVFLSSSCLLFHFFPLNVMPFLSFTFWNITPFPENPSTSVNCFYCTTTPATPPPHFPLLFLPILPRNLPSWI